MSKFLKRFWPIALIALLLVAVLLWRRASRASDAAAPTPSAAATPSAPAAKPAPSAATAPVTGAPASATPADELADPRAALATALGYREPGLRAQEFGRLLQLWIARDLEAALAYVRAMPRGAAFTEGLLLVLDAVSRRDPDRALALAAELAVTRDDRVFYSVLFDRLARENLATAVAKLTLVPAGDARDNASRALASLWARTDAAAALAWAQKLPDADRAAALESALSELALKDPLQVIEVAQKSLTGPALDRAVFNALEKLSATDPAGASGLVTLLPPGEMQLLAAVDVARAFAAQNVEAALAWTKTLPPGNTQTTALNNVLAMWARSDATAAGNYVATLPPGPLQHVAAVELAGTLAHTSVKSAIEWAQSLPAADTRPVALARIADAWAQQDPAAASRWVVEQANGPLAFTAQTLGYTLSYWVQKDATATEEFVRGLPASLQAGAAASTAPLLAQNDPVAALAWAQSLPLPAARDAALGAAFGRWLDNAPAAARAWLAASNLPAETKTRLASPVP